MSDTVPSDRTPNNRQDFPLDEPSATETRALVQAYYGQQLQTSDDLQTDACCTLAAPSDAVKARLGKLHDETLARYFGCGLIAPPALEGARVLDLGCGAGRDVYLLSQMVGPEGFVTGVDMTDEQLEVAQRHLDWHMDAFGFDRPNVSFHKGLIERLEDLPLEPGSFDVVVSNCVINLVPDKAAALRGVRRLMKPGGEFYFSDVYADRRLSPEQRAHPLLYGECLGGALYWRDFLSLARAAGFPDPRLVETRPLAINNAELSAMLGAARFSSTTYRLFAHDGLDGAPEDYGLSATYRGGVEGEEERFAYDARLGFERGVVTAVSADVWRSLRASRFAGHFTFDGDLAAHAGAFAEPPQPSPFDPDFAGDGAVSSGCCG